MDRLTDIRIFFWQRCLIAFTLAACHVNACAAVEDDSFSARKNAWQHYLEQRKFVFRESLADITNSISRLSGNYQLHIICDPSQKPHSASPTPITIKLVREGKELLAVPGHLGSVFLKFGDKFLFAHFSRTHPGCVVTAYDMTTGKRLWKTSDLRDFGPFGYTAGYLNQVTVRPSRANEVLNEDEGDSIVVTGRESFGDYITVIDRKTGTILATKIYRVGFGPPPPHGGGFDGRSAPDKRRGFGGPGGISDTDNQSKSIGRD